MKEVFQTYDHYSEWISNNWNKNELLDKVIIKDKLMVGQPFRQLTKDEFNKRDKKNFIWIPVIN